MLRNRSLQNIQGHRVTPDRVRAIYYYQGMQAYMHNAVLPHTQMGRVQRSGWPIRWCCNVVLTSMQLCDAAAVQWEIIRWCVNDAITC